MSVFSLKLLYRYKLRLVKYTPQYTQAYTVSFVPLHSPIIHVQPPGSTCSSHLSLCRPPGSSSLKFFNRSLVYAAKDSQKTSVSLLIFLTDLLISPLGSTPLAPCHSSLHGIGLYIPLTTEDQTFQAILSRFHSCATTRSPSSLIATGATRVSQV